MIKIATIEDEENIRQEIVRYIKKGIGSIEGVEVDYFRYRTSGDQWSGIREKNKREQSGCVPRFSNITL